VSLPASLQELVEQFKKLPGIGAKSATRLAFHVLRTPREDAERLCQAIRDVKDRVTYCSTCNNITDVDPCPLCGDPGRDRRIICVVEEPQNVAVVDRTGGFRGDDLFFNAPTLVEGQPATFTRRLTQAPRAGQVTLKFSF
jgi:recombination protein RecR